jgi:hypothetical protein
VSVEERCITNPRSCHERFFDSLRSGAKLDNEDQSRPAIPADLRTVEAPASISAKASFLPTVLDCAHLNCSYASRTSSHEVKWFWHLTTSARAARAVA